MKLSKNIKLDENKVQDVAEKLATVCNTYIATKEEIIHELYGKDEFKTELIIVADEMFSQNEKELDESNQVIKTRKIILETINLKMMY